MDINKKQRPLLYHSAFVYLYFWILFFFFAQEENGTFSAVAEKWMVRIMLVVLHVCTLNGIYTDILSHQYDPRRPGYASGIVLIVLFMIINEYVTSYLFMLLMSTIAARIMWVSWVFMIFKVIVRKWKDTTHQMSIVNVVA
jgi:hypothetical protein